MIHTPCGAIEGLVDETNHVISYRGIPYASCIRFGYPELTMKWEGTLDATKYGNCCYQKRAFYDEREDKGKAFYYKEFRENETYTYSEDCLFLNIWTPDDVTDASQLPVIVYIHGGSFTGGCGHEKHFDGPVWTKHKVVAVTINYRLGPFGFFCIPELNEEAGHAGNYAMFDQVTALRWIKENIKYFGGDPNNITLMGQSAGAMSVQQHCLSPLSKNLFSKAVMSSGAGVNAVLNVKKSMEEQYSFWTKVMEQAGCNSLEELRRVSPKEIYDAYENVKKEDKKAGMVCFPCVDGVFLEESSLETIKKENQKKIPYIVGSNSHDIFPPVFHKMAKSWCLKQKSEDTYCYLFERNLPGDENGAWHSSDLWYWFGTLKNCWRPFDDIDVSLSETMVSYLCNFARTGNPNGEGLPEWKPTNEKQKQIMLFGEEPAHMGKPDMKKLFSIMMKNKSVGE